MTEVDRIKYLQSQLGKSYKWGRTDCNAFAIEFFDYCNNTVFRNAVIGKYDDEKTAYKFAKKIGLLRNYLPLIKTNRPKIGDLILVKDGVWDMAHIYLGDKVLTSINGKGITTMPTPHGEVYTWAEQ